VRISGNRGCASPVVIAPDAHFHPIREVLRVRNTGPIRDVRYVEADYERRPPASVPDAIFGSRGQGLRASVDRQSFVPASIARDVQLRDATLVYFPGSSPPLLMES
jgi:hypothetical protein